MKSQLAGSFFIESSKPPAQSNKQWVCPARTQIVQKFSKVQLRFSPYNNCRKKDCKNPPKVNDGKAEAGMNRKRKNEKKTIGLAALLVASQLFQVANVSADSQEYSGVTQIASEEVYLDVNDLEVSLEVAEVCVAAGDSVQEGDALLKLTGDSYEKAVAYYTAALLRARSSLTDTQLEYDQGILSAKYTYEMAQAEAENAESVKEYQTNEVTSALTEHADTLEDIADRIEELTDGIADGSYATGSSSSGGTSGTGSTGGGSASGKASGGVQESETQSEGGQQESSTSGNEQESNAQTESGTGSSEQESNEQPGNGEQETGNQTDNDQQQTDNNIGSGTPEKSVAELKQELTATLEEMDTRGTSITEALKQLTDHLGTKETDNQSDYDTYANQLNNLITELTADIRAQEQAKEKLQDGSETALDDSIAGNTRVLESLQDIQKRLQKYQGLIGTVLGLLDTGNASVMVDADILEDITEYIQLQEKCSNLYTELITRYEEELADNANTPSETLPDGSGSDSSKETEAGNDDTKPDVQETESNGLQETDESESGSGMNGQPSTEEGTSGGGMPSGSSGNSMASGFSGGTGGMSAGASADSSSAGAAQSGQSASMGTDGFDMSSADISILGNAYDLTQVKSLLEQEPSDEDAAEDLLEQLTDSLEEVQTQYEELQRMEKIYKLQIQYTYDTTKLAAQLAEITYEQELLEWENTLSEAKEEQETIEEQKAMLDAMTDGTICAQQNGIVASVSYDEGDVISSSVPVISYYDTDTVTVTLEIPQEEIAGIAVGQTVKVQMDRFGTIEGTVSEKSVEPESGTSRTNVIYTVEVSIENETGRINSGTAATVTFSEAENAGEEG